MTSKRHLLSIALFVIIMLFAFSSSVFAVNANPDPFPFTQPDGTLIAVRLFGDEFLHWEEDANGNLIVFDDDKEGYCYGLWTDEGAVSTGDLAGAGLSVVMFRGHGQGNIIPQKVLDKAAEYREELTAGLYDDKPLIQALTAAMAAPTGTPPVYASVDKMKRKMLMIHVTFEDRSNIRTRDGEVMPKMSGKQIYDLCFGLREEVDRSVNGYYQDILMTDEIIITPAEVLMPMDGYQGVVEVVLPGQHPNYASDDPKSAAAMRDAMVKVCAETRIDLKQFDTDSNGTLATAELAIGMIFDGFEYSMGRIVPNFWGVSIGSGSTPTANLTQDIKIASLFAQGAFHRNSGDVYDDAGTPGVIVHEMGHSGYSFQDTYDTGSLSAGSGGGGYWSMQASGDNGRLPGEYAGATSGYQCAYNLVRSGFVIPGVLAYGETAVMNNHLDIYLAQTPVVTPVENTPVTNYFGVQYRGQYFLLQQRKFGDTFNYDQGAFGYISSNTGVPVDASIGGMLIQHIDLNVPTNRIANKPGHYRSGYEEAHGGVQSMQQRSGYPGRMGEFSDLWGVSKFEFSYKSDPGSGIYKYDDGRTWVNALTPIPNQNTPSGVNITDILWDPVTMTTSFSMGYKIVVNFPGVDGVTVQYYSTAGGWENLPGTYDDTCTFYPPEDLDVTAVRVQKSTFMYNFNKLIVGRGHLFLDVPPFNFLVRIESPQTKLVTGETLYADVILTGDISYATFEATIDYDKDLLQYVGYDNLAGAVAQVKMQGANTLTIKSVPSLYVTVGAPCTTPVKMVTLRFRVITGQTLDSNLNFKSVVIHPAANTPLQALTGPALPLAISLN